MEWLKNRLSQHAETDSHPDLELLRLAADGCGYKVLPESLMMSNVQN
jgi:hypothetical protein